MSVRSGWTVNRKHFTQTTTPRGGIRYFIDGKPTKRADWYAALYASNAAAKAAKATAEHGDNR
jgi:hypothetical protein